MGLSASSAAEKGGADADDGGAFLNGHREIAAHAHVACLNHIPNRSDVLKESHRLLKPGGRLIIIMINPILGGIIHNIWWRHSEDKIRGGMKDGEVGGMWNSSVNYLVSSSGFTLLYKLRFNLQLVSLMVFQKV